MSARATLSGTAHRILVIGAGVSGLTSALCLAREGFEVKVVADRFAPEIVSVVAGALWEWPPAVCGYHHDQISLARSKDWCMTSYDIFDDLARDPDTGVFMRQVNFYFKRSIDEYQHDLNKMHELIPKVRGFVRDVGLVEANGVSARYGIVDAYAHLAPMIDTDRYMGWLHAQVLRAGVEIVQGRIEGRLADQEDRLLAEHRVDAIVNCTGLGAAELHGRPMFPLRGALVRVRNDGRRIPQVLQAHCVSHDERSDEQDIVFIVPRGREMLVLGGLAEADEWSLDIGLHNHQPVRDMYERCLEFMPLLRDAELVVEEPVRVGLRPFRRQNVCLEPEPGTTIFHNYAHGGAGFSFSWGCAQEVARHMKELLRGGSFATARGRGAADVM